MKKQAVSPEEFVQDWIKHKRLLTREEYDTLFIPGIPANACTFCEWGKYQIVLKEFEYWVWIACNAPYWDWHTMLIPKRHFVEYEEQLMSEASEFLLLAYPYAKKKMLDSELFRGDGTPVEKIANFWRYRRNRFDPISQTVRPNHFHLHTTPDKDHLWDSTLDLNAHLCPVQKRLGFGRGRRVFLNKI